MRPVNNDGWDGWRDGSGSGVGLEAGVCSGVSVGVRAGGVSVAIGSGLASRLNTSVGLAVGVVRATVGRGVRLGVGETGDAFVRMGTGVPAGSVSVGTTTAVACVCVSTTATDSVVGSPPACQTRPQPKNTISAANASRLIRSSTSHQARAPLPRPSAASVVVMVGNSTSCCRIRRRPPSSFVLSSWHVDCIRSECYVSDVLCSLLVSVRGSPPDFKDRKRPHLARADLFLPPLCYIPPITLTLLAYL